MDRFCGLAFRVLVPGYSCRSNTCNHSSGSYMWVMHSIMTKLFSLNLQVTLPQHASRDAMTITTSKTPVQNSILQMVVIMLLLMLMVIIIMMMILTVF